MKKIAILGSTGSIGTQTLEVVDHYKDEFQVVALSAGKNIDLLEQQVRAYKPLLVSIWSSEDGAELSRRLKDMKVEIVIGMEGLLQVATLPESDILVTAIVGMIGIRPTIAAIQAGKDIALANKETLVTAGHLIMPMAKEKGVHIYPVDSEHSAIFQCLNGENRQQLSRILLTASGGPFRNRSLKDLETVTLKDALKHPNWSMGQKITIDSATMVNKGLEVIEAKWLFDVDVDQITVVVQPQSVIHSMVEFADGGVLAQLGTPDMKLPIQYALMYPNRCDIPGERLDFWKLGKLDFQAPDMEVFRGLPLAYQVGRIGGSAPTVFNAANEYAVSQFLQEKIGFLDIYAMIEDALGGHTLVEQPDLQKILECEQWTYDYLKGRW